MPLNNKSPHILNTSSNLLGFCLVVLTSLRISNYNSETLIDEFTGITCVLLITCSIFSFLAIRTSKANLSLKYENIADTIFLTALLLVFAIAFLVAFSFIF